MITIVAGAPSVLGQASRKRARPIEVAFGSELPENTFFGPILRGFTPDRLEFSFAPFRRRDVRFGDKLESIYKYYLVCRKIRI